MIKSFNKQQNIAYINELFSNLKFKSTQVRRMQTSTMHLTKLEQNIDKFDLKKSEVVDVAIKLKLQL